MKRIKELNTIIYEIKDLKGKAIDKAIINYAEEGFIMEQRTDFSKLIDIIDDYEYFYDKAGNRIYIYSDVKDDEIKYSLYLTESLSIDVTLENIQGVRCYEKN